MSSPLKLYLEAFTEAGTRVWENKTKIEVEAENWSYEVTDWTEEGEHSVGLQHLYKKTLQVYISWTKKDQGKMLSIAINDFSDLASEVQIEMRANDKEDVLFFLGDYAHIAGSDWGSFK